MKLTWGQKKATMKEFISKYYADALRSAGFVSYKDEGFHWYKLKNDLLYKVHLPISSPASPLFLEVGYGVVPLFTWEFIAPVVSYADWPLQMHSLYDHYISLWTNWGYDIAKQTLGTLPRKSYFVPGISYHLPNGVLIDHLRSPRCGAEALEEAIFPIFEKLQSVEDVYCWNKESKLFLTESSYNTFKYDITYCLSFAFADQCLYLRDTQMYPLVLRYLDRESKRLIAFPQKTKENVMAVEHAAVLIRAMESGDMTLFDNEAKLVRERMLKQIKKKLPDMICE